MYSDYSGATANGNGRRRKKFAILRRLMVLSLPSISTATRYELPMCVSAEYEFSYERQQFYCSV